MPTGTFANLQTGQHHHKDQEVVVVVVVEEEVGVGVEEEVEEEVEVVPENAEQLLHRMVMPTTLARGIPLVVSEVGRREHVAPFFFFFFFFFLFSFFFQYCTNIFYYFFIITETVFKGATIVVDVVDYDHCCEAPGTASTNTTGDTPPQNGGAVAQVGAAAVAIAGIFNIVLGCL